MEAFILRHVRRSLLLTLGFVLSGTLMLGGVEKVVVTPDGNVSVAVTPVGGAAKTTPVSPATPAGDKDHQICFQCGGRGTTVCRAGCRGGKIDCPAPCLKLTQGTWEHMTVAGHGPNELWQKFMKEGGGWQAWNQNHVGEVIAMQNGIPVNIGKCKVCGGTTKIDCPRCKGTGLQVCELCEGKKVIPISWTPTDNPVINRRTDHIVLKDGRVVLGKIVMQTSKQVVIRTQAGKFEYLTPADLATPPEAATK